MVTLARHFEEGGGGMYPILCCSIVMLAAALVALARLWARRPSADRLIAEIDRALALGDVDAAVAVAADPRAPAERIALAGLRESLQPVPRIEAALASALLAELPRLRSGHRALATTTQVATLFGLFGTITGLCFGFGHGNGDATSRAQMLARGISEAMNCTAFGLFVSTCSLALAFVVDARGEMLRRELELVGRAVANSLATHRPALRWLGARAPMDRPTYRSAA